MRDVKPSALEDAGEQLELAECLLKVGENVAAVDLLHSVDPTRLSEYMPIMWSFLLLLADRLAGAPQLSEELLVKFLREVAQRIDWIGATSLDFSFTGVRRLLARSELSVLDRLVLATLIDVQEAKVPYNNLSFFTEIWKDFGAPTRSPT